MTYDQIIQLLEEQENTSKQNILKMFKNASIEDLAELRQSINEKIRIERSLKSESGIIKINK